MIRRAVVLLAASLLIQGQPARAQANPGHLTPLGGQAGTRLTLAFGGEGLPETAALEVLGKGIRPLGPFKKGKGEIEIEAGAAPGPRLLRLRGAAAITTPRPFSVGPFPEQIEREPNETLDEATRIAQLPATLNGSLPKREDVDIYRVALRAGDCLVIASESRSLGAPTDLMVRVRDSRRVELAGQLDHRTRDPLLAFTAPADGDYWIELLDEMNNYSGINADYVYRVHVTTGPWIDYAFPAQVQAGALTEVTMHGFNLGAKRGASAQTIQVDPPAGAGARLGIGEEKAPFGVELEVSDLPHVMEGAPLPAPGVAHGRLARPGETDRFRFRAEKGQKLLLLAESRALGGAADLQMRLLRAADGTELASADDSGGSRDARLTWRAPETGDYILSLTDIAGTVRGGPEFFYRLTVGPPQPSLRLSAPALIVTGKPGEEVSLEVTATHEEKPGRLELRVEGLPKFALLQPASPLELTGESGSAKTSLKIKISPNAAPGVYPLTIVEAQPGSSTPAAAVEASWPLATDRSGTLAEGRSDAFALVIAAK